MNLNKDRVYVETRSVNKTRAAIRKGVELTVIRSGLANNGLS